MSSHIKRSTGLSDCSKVDKIHVGPLKKVKEPQMHMLPSPRRTDGDGMENAVDAQPEILKETRTSLGKTLIYRPEDFKLLSSPPPPKITGKIVNLDVPKQTTGHKKTKSIGTFKPREPKFVPYEPYKAAVKPIIPFEKTGGKKERIKKLAKRPDSDINEMIRKLSNVRVEGQSSLPGGAKEGACAASPEREVADGASRKEIARLKEEIVQLEGQLKFQIQVNGDLKTLLVAAVGEDLETRVQHLTEDKLQLARALLSSAQVCTSHQERTEFLAGQCEVWRSKFLASSLMLEELASRKTSMSLHITELEDIVRKLLAEISVIREYTHSSYKSLSVIHDSLAPSEVGNTSGSVTVSAMDLASACEHLSLALRSRLVAQQQQQQRRRDVALQLVDSTTELEAREILNSGIALTQKDAASNAVMGAAIAVATRQTACCSHCSGEIKQV